MKPATLTGINEGKVQICSSFQDAMLKTQESTGILLNNVWNIKPNEIRFCCKILFTSSDRKCRIIDFSDVMNFHNFIKNSTPYGVLLNWSIFLWFNLFLPVELLFLSEGSPKENDREYKGSILVWYSESGQWTPHPSSPLGILYTYVNVIPCHWITNPLQI